MIPIGQHAQHHPMLIETGDDFQRRVVQATIAAERASFQSILSRPSRAPVDDNFGGTSTTCSPVATSGWANNAAIPFVPSIAHVHGENGAAHANGLAC